MATLSLAPRGKILGLTRFVDAVPRLIELLELIENWSSRIGSDNIVAGAIGTSELADASVTAAKVVDGIGRTASGQFTGDGVADREINVGFRPRFIWMIRQDTSMTFEGVGSASSALAAGRRTSAGVWTGSVVLDNDFQGPSANGILLGHAAGGGLSNAVGQTYSYFAEK